MADLPGDLGDARRDFSSATSTWSHGICWAGSSWSTAKVAIAVRLTEVEAYAGLDDPASHAFRGTTPSDPGDVRPGRSPYTYFVYGMHWCANIVTGADGDASAVLLRAGEVVDGVELARIAGRG